MERKSLRPNVRFVSKTNTSQHGQGHNKKKFTLADMLKNAKKVEREVGQPIVDSLREAGHIPNPFLDQIEESVMNKVDSFSRKLDGPFTREFGRKYHEIRQEAWKKAKDKERKNPFGNVWTNVRGSAFSAPDDALMWHFDKKNTFIRQGNFKVKLPSPVMNWYKTNAFEASLIYSGLATGNVSTSVERLEYQTEFEGEDVREYIHELDELKYIYKGYWYLSGINRKDWLTDLYRDPDRKILDYRFSQVPCPDGLRRGDNVVLMVIEGTDFYVHVEDLFKWIEHYRLPKKKYAIGECECELGVHYAIYLEHMYGFPESIIKERLTIDLLENVRNHMDVLHLATDPEKENSEYDEDAEALRALGVTTQLDLIKAEERAVQAQEVMYKMVAVDFSNGIIDLNQLDDGETDSFVSSEEHEEMHEDHWEGELPYEPGLHVSNDEYVSLYDPKAEKPEVNIDEDAESVISDDLPDKVLNPLDELGIDLIDPSRDTTDNPVLRRIGLVWDPGGGRRTNIRRFVRKRG